MFRYATLRLAQGFITILGVLVIVFFIIRLTGDPVDMMLPPEATRVEREELREHLGLNEPLPVQFGVFVSNALHGDFGPSLRYGEPALGLVLVRLPKTIALTAAAVAIASVLGIVLGVLSASARSPFVDGFATGFALIGQSMPSFWLGLMLILFVGYHWQLLPIAGADSWRHMVLPAFALGAHSTARIFQLVRSGMLEELRKEYVRTAEAKGMSAFVVSFKHALRNVAIPTITMIGLQAGFIFGSSVVIEQVFAWPGVGRLIITSIFNRDHALVQAAVLVLAIVFVLINILVDLLYGVVDPRIRYG